MRLHRWSLFGLVLAAAAGLSVRNAQAADEKIKVEALGTSPAYKLLSRLPIEHAGRVKPIDTVAREEIKLIYGREKIQLPNAEGKFFQSWEPVAALFDWTARPEYWSKQSFILVEYLPLKWKLLHDDSKTLLTDIANKPSTSAADKEALNKLAESEDITPVQLTQAIATTTLGEADVKALQLQHEKLGEGHKWLSPTELEEAVVNVDGKPMPFSAWVDSISEKNRQAEETPGQVKLTDLEDKAHEVGVKLGRFRTLRDRGDRFVPIFLMPRPSSKAYMVYTGDVLSRGQKSGGRDMNEFDLDSAVTFNKYLKNVPSKEHVLPGSNEELDAKYAAWLRDDSPWMTYGALMSATPEQLESAGFPVDKYTAFTKAIKSVDEGEKATPGNLDEAIAQKLLDSGRELAAAINPGRYPTPGEIGREVLYNTSAPFWWSPVFYGLGAILLALSLTVRGRASSFLQMLHKLFYGSGMAMFIAGIVLEIYGFTLRVMITGWAPVTTMAETVIYVGAVTALLGFVFELIYRRTYSALAAAAVAAFATGLSAHVALLDPSIKPLQPVLRSNFWLTIHVLTIVSSYAAFALTWGLGLLATCYYLTATYRRSAKILDLLSPLLAGGPVLAFGIVLFLGSRGSLELGQFVRDWGLYPSLVIVTVGAILFGGGIVAALGELLNRFLAADVLRAADAYIAPSIRTKQAFPEDRELVGAGAQMPPLSGGSQEAEDVDPRTAAMRETASVIKPLSNFIYRAMQVGVLLVAAGTILGGVWADASWGRFWGWDAKEVWALVTLLVYLVPLHGRFAGWVNTFGLVIASVVCFLSVLMAWYGVNFVLGVGLHAYGFTKGGSQGVVFVFTLLVLTLPAGAYWRRHLCQNVAVA